VVAQGGLVQRTWSPAGWSRVTPGAARLLDAARREAEAMGAGFVGLEHLVRALGTTADRESLAAIRFALSPYRNALFERLGHLRRVGSRVPDWRGTPRLRALGDVLPADVDVVGLWQAIWNEPTLALQALAEMPVDLVAPGMDSQDRTLEPDGVRLQQLVQTATPTALEVLGGPEDGQRFQPGEGDVVGRHTSGSMTTHGLYRDTVLVDPYLSRSALVWLGPGRVSLSRQAARRRANQWQDVGPGPIHVMVGDQLLITPATRLRVLP